MPAIRSNSFVEPYGTVPLRIDVGNLTMNVVVAGSGRPILFIHGLGWDHTLWGRQINRLSNRYLVVAGDTRGHGGTDKPDGPYAVRQFVDDYAALLDKLELSSVLIVGFSLGGMIAQWLAVLRPDLVGALVLVGTTCSSPAVGLKHMDERLAAMTAGGAIAAAELAAISVFSQGWREAHPDQLADFITWRTGHDQAALREVMRAVADFDIREHLPQLTVPTLVITALGDTLMPPDVQAPLQHLIPGAIAVELADAGHMVSIELPEQFDAILENFLDREWCPRRGVA